MKEICADVWELLDSNSAVCILTNNTVYDKTNTDMSTSVLVNPMGGGIAREAVQRNPGLDKICGQAIIDNKYSLGYDKMTQAEMLRFPTMKSIGSLSNLELIEDSLSMVADYCKSNPHKNVYLPRPGCGIGGLNWHSQVKPLCENILGKFDNLFIVTK